MLYSKLIVIIIMIIIIFTSLSSFPILLCPSPSCVCPFSRTGMRSAFFLLVSFAQHLPRPPSRTSHCNGKKCKPAECAYASIFIPAHLSAAAAVSFHVCVCCTFFVKRKKIPSVTIQSAGVHDERADTIDTDGYFRCAPDCCHRVRCLRVATLLPDPRAAIPTIRSVYVSFPADFPRLRASVPSRSNRQLYLLPSPFSPSIRCCPRVDQLIENITFSCSFCTESAKREVCRRLTPRSWQVTRCV